MAAPHVTGAIALYLQEHSAASLDEIARFLRSQGTWGALNGAGAFSDNVLLKVTNLSVGSDPPPTATYSASCNGHLCSFNAAGSAGGTFYQWDFGDGATASGTTASHTFATNFNGRVNLTVTSATGKTAHFSRRFTFDNGGPQAVLLANCSGLTCSFDASQSTPAPGSSLAAKDWCFGDSTCVADQQFPNRTYAAAGSYTVTLTVTDSNSAQATVTKLVTVSSAAAPAAESFFSIPPCRVLDTRNTTVLSNAVPRIVPVTGHCSIPAGAKAVSFNLTAVSPTGTGFFSFYPGTSSASTATTSTINFTAAQVLANNAILPLGTDGTLGVLPSVAPSPSVTPGQVHLLVDVDGYFSDTNPAGGTPLGFETLTPCRIADTRSSTPLNLGDTRSFSVLGGACGIPAGAAAASLNLTAIPDFGSLGFLSIFPAGGSSPSSTINFDSTLLANGARPTLAAPTTPPTPEVSVSYGGGHSGNRVNVILDANGYFAPLPPGSPLLRYYPITPCRAVDTRFSGQGAPALVGNQSRTFQIQGNCGVPLDPAVKAAFVNITAVQPSAAAFLTAYPASLNSPPLVSTLNVAAGEILANGAIVPLKPNSTNDLAIYVNTGTVDVIVDVFGYFK